MVDKTFEAKVDRVLSSSPEQVWALLADTNRFDRAAGLAAPVYSVRPGEQLSPPYPFPVRVASAREMGLPIDWTELPYEWIEGSWLKGRRNFSRGPANQAIFEVHVAPHPRGSSVCAKVTISGPSPLLRIAGPIAKMRMVKALQRFLTAIEETRPDSPPSSSRAKASPAAQSAKLSLLNACSNPITSGPTSPTNKQSLAHAASRFELTPVQPAMRSTLLSLIVDRPDEELTQIRPFEISSALGIDRVATLKAFLHATSVGLFDLHWQVNCPSCQVATKTTTSLAHIDPKVHCPACDIHFDTDFSRHVEAVFQVNQAIRKVQSAVYCMSSPWFRPHVFAQLLLEANEQREITIPRLPIELNIRSIPAQGHSATTTADLRLSSELSIIATAEQLSLVSGDAPLLGETIRVKLHNQTEQPRQFVFERTGWTADRVLGSTIATLPEFLTLFASEAPAVGLELDVGSLAILFSDLTGSTELYGRLGDARAFALVQEHFRQMSEIISQHEGAVIKTMGDAVMASFSRPDDALLAALEMSHKTRQSHQAQGIELKVGFHFGPCLAVRANQHLDFFGSTVNLAARLQSSGRASQVVFLAELLTHPAIVEQIRVNNLVPKTVELQLKGFNQTQRAAVLDT